MQKTDSVIQQEVLQELKWDTRVEETEVGVTVERGVVTLSGNVSSWAKRIAAQQAAHRVRSVLDVANDLQVRIPQSFEKTDTEIAAAVRIALESDALVHGSRIQSTVSNGWVELEGQVEYWSDREDAEKCIRNLKCLRGVTNKIEVNPPKLTVGDIKLSIQDALERQAKREARGIRLQVDDGVVSVSGDVHSWPEKQSVLGAVKGTPGVRRVEDRVRVSPYA